MPSIPVQFRRPESDEQHARDIHRAAYADATFASDLLNGRPQSFRFPMVALRVGPRRFKRALVIRRFDDSPAPIGSGQHSRGLRPLDPVSALAITLWAAGHEWRSHGAELQWLLRARS